MDSHTRTHARGPANPKCKPAEKRKQNVAKLVPPPPLPPTSSIFFLHFLFLVCLFCFFFWSPTERFANSVLRAKEREEERERKRVSISVLFCKIRQRGRAPCVDRVRNDVIVRVAANGESARHFHGPPLPPPTNSSPSPHPSGPAPSDVITSFADSQ